MRSLFSPDLTEFVTTLTLCFLAAKEKRETGSVSDFKALRIVMNQNWTRVKKMVRDVIHVVLYNTVSKILYFIFYHSLLHKMSLQHSLELIIIIGL